jgi:hypothetical protein
MVRHLFVTSLNAPTGRTTVKTLVLDDPDAVSVSGFAFTLSWRSMGLGFATTAFRAQGGEAKLVIAPVSASNFSVCVRNLSVIVTRAKVAAVILCEGESNHEHPAMPATSSIVKSIQEGPKQREDVLEYALAHLLADQTTPWTHEFPPYDEHVVPERAASPPSDAELETLQSDLAALETRVPWTHPSARGKHEALMAAKRAAIEDRRAVVDKKRARQAADTEEAIERALDKFYA